MSNTSKGMAAPKSATGSTLAADMLAKVEGTKTPAKATSKAKPKLAKLPKAVYRLTNSAAAGSQLRAYFIAGMQMAGVITKTGLPTKAGGSAKWLRDNVTPMAKALSYHSGKGNLAIEGDTVTLVGNSPLAGQFTTQVKSLESLIEAYLTLMTTGKATEAIQAASNAKPHILAPKAAK